MDAPQFDPADFDLAKTPAFELDLSDEAATRRLGYALADALDAGAFVGLIGNLGAGKTTLVQAVVERLSPHAEATSPTYTLLNDYETDPPVVHVDLYRLETYDELESIGYWDYAESGWAITFVEWLDRIPQAWPRHGLMIELERAGTTRTARLWASAEYRSTLEGIGQQMGCEPSSGTPKP